MVRGSRSALLLGLLGLTALGPAVALPKENLYPYTGFGTSTLDLDAEGQLLSVEATLKTPIFFYDQKYDTIFVNGNGVLSFRTSMPTFFNIPFPLDYPAIAPLYTHVDTRGSGTVYWGETDEPGVVTRSSSTIRQTFKNADNFQATHVFLATWVDVGYYNEKADKVNTYQVAVSSNGTHSYAELLYPESGVQWIQGDSHPNGLPDAKAQAGFVTYDRMYILKGSGTDQIQNIDKWSNVNKPGEWLFQIGPIPEGENVKLADNIQGSPANNEISSCFTGATSCHSKADCVDYEAGFCCACKQGFFGNGKSCQPYDLPLRVIGIVSGYVNNQEFPPKDLQCYVQTKDGRTYTAMSRVPEFLGPSSQLLNILGGVLGWLFAKPVGETKNGYQLTGGVFNHTADLVFATSGEKLTIRTQYLGLDVFGQLKLEADIKGTLPTLQNDARVDYGDHEELYTKTQPGTILSQSTRSYKLIGAPEVEYQFNQEQVITYEGCEHGPHDPMMDTTRLKFSRGMTSYEEREQIIRFAMNTKIAPLEEEDPCIQGKSQCGYHSSCIVEGDAFKCVCNPGYQHLWEEDGTANCVDINECTAGTHVCSPDALCVNNEGGHACHCREGFIGDGRNCDKQVTCDNTSCGDFADCAIEDGVPVCSCYPGYESTGQGCFPIQHDSCDAENNCSPYGSCSFDGDRDKHVCVCLAGYIGDGYTCEPESELSTVMPTNEPREPHCERGTCWCPSGWELRNNNECVEQERTPEGPTETSENLDDKHLSARPEPQCYDYDCDCPWGYEYNHQEEICDPKPGYNHETMGASGSQSSCNVMNTCHPYAQCIFITSTEDYECQCNPGYEGDGFECTKPDGNCLGLCGPHAYCYYDGTLEFCNCDEGYEGDGMTCKPIGECVSGSDCVVNEECLYMSSSSRYECACARGYDRVDGQCVVADCSTNPSQCHVNGQCVSTSEGGYKCVCIGGYHGDGVNECVEDHIGCNSINNCGRNALCGYNQVTATYACMCHPGFYGDGFTCLPESSCRRDPSLCSPDATCVTTGDNQFACVCNEGFSGDGADCKVIPKHDANMLLVNHGMATLRVPFVPTPGNPGSAIHFSPFQLGVGLDIDCLGGMAYLTDIQGQKITAISYNGSVSNTFISDVNSPEGISVDWVSRNVFWTDSGKKTVEVANLNTKKRKVLVFQGLENPRGIAVHPYRGKIFWSDWNRKAPKLEWSNEDGTERTVFLQGDSVKSPNSLAIDWSTDEICWADADTKTISCANIDTRDVRIVAKELVWPFGLAISQNNYYWTDWKTSKIEVASKNSGKKTKSLSIPPGGGDKLYGIVAVPESCPRVSNVCQYENGRCSEEQLCLPDGQGGRTCACADNAFGPCTDSRYPSY